MSEKIKPALTPEEWSDWEHTGTSHVAQKARTGVFGQPRLHVNLSPLDPDEGYALAALALYSQPFGFHQKDVDFLRSLGHIDADEIASRIEALLPPKTDETGTPKTRREGR